jgi:hypothetical protein
MEGKKIDASFGEDKDALWELSRFEEISPNLHIFFVKTAWGRLTNWFG